MHRHIGGAAVIVLTATIGGGCAATPPGQQQSGAQPAATAQPATTTQSASPGHQGGQAGSGDLEPAGKQATATTEGGSDHHTKDENHPHGELPPKVIQGEIGRSIGDIKRCYLEELKRDATAQGKMTLRLVIDSSGTVTKVTSSSHSDLSDAVVACVEQVAGKLTFPAPRKGEVWVSYPITLAQNGPGSSPQSRAGIEIGEAQRLGWLPPKLIQKIVRQSFGTFRKCYEAELARDPNAAGRLAIRFVIGPDGRVSNVGVSGDELPDDVAQCVVNAFYKVRFPKPNGGIVTVSYPIVFSPGKD